MSSCGGNSPDWREYLEAMVEHGERALTNTRGMSKEDFAANHTIFDATLRNLQVIGEAAQHIPQHVSDAHPAIPWRKIRGFRSRIAHTSISVNDDLIWRIVRDDLPGDIPRLRALLAAYEDAPRRKTPRRG